MSDRSEAEREAARLEREAARRAADEAQAEQAPADAAVVPAVIDDDFDHPPAQPGAAGMPHRPVTIPRPRRRHGLRIAIATVFALILVAGLYLANGIFTPTKGAGSGRVVVRVPAGSSARSIGNLLAENGVVDSGFFFSLRAGIAGKRDALRSGTFTLRHDMNNGKALDALTTAPPVAPTIRVVLPEGPGRRQFAVRAKRQGVTGDYVAASVRSPALNPRSYGAPKGTRSLEGFLYPATYQLPRGASARRLVREQLKAFKDAMAQIDLRRARKKNLTAFDVLTLASIIEREVFLPRDRRRVAAVFYNRLKAGVALGSDATTRYAVNNFLRPLRVSELNSDSKYNTRKSAGLPPGPIGNPGLGSIEAAANPLKTKEFFFIVKPCGNGALSFAVTDAGFQKLVAAYDAKRAELGGKDPSRCP